MSMTKFAKLDVNVLEVKSASSQVRTASLNRLSDFNDYRTEDGYLYVRIRAISSRVNKNHDGWPSVELAGSPEIFERHHSANGFVVEADTKAEYGFSTFLHKPFFVDHHNSNPDRTRGVVVDSKLHVEDARTSAALDPYYASAPDNHKPPTWVELLIEVDAKSFPRLAQALIEGAKDPSKGIDGFSMGCNVEMSKCSHCGNEATHPGEYCEHIQMKGRNFPHTDPQTGRTSSKRSYEDCYGVQFFEISGVFDPADETALTRELVAATNPGLPSLYHEPEVAEIEQLARSIVLENPGMSLEEAMPMAMAELQNRFNVSPQQLHGEGETPEFKVRDTTRLPQGFPTMPYRPDGVRPQGRTAAEPPLPQSDLIHSPESVNTLRDEEVCPVCGETMDDDECPLCHYVKPPDGMDNPDLSKAQQMDPHNQPIPPKVPLDETELQDKTLPSPSMPGVQPRNNGPLSHVTGDMARWTVLDSRIAGRINSVERPIRPGTGQSTSEPQEQILSDQTKPVTSSVRTAGEFIAAAGRETGDTMKTADSADTVATPGTRVDVDGVGGVMDGSNEQASKADAQVDVTAVGGTGVEGVAPDHTESIEETSDNAGFDTSKQIDGTPSATFPDTGQQDPVTNDVFPASDEGVKKSHDDGVFPADDGGLAGGNAVQGVKPVAEQFGERVDVLDHTTSPSNNSGPTKTWSGTDGNGVTKQVDPTTPESIATDGFGKGSNAHLFAAFKLADLEVELGLTPAEKKFDRAAELEQQEPSTVIASLDYAKRVKTAGLSRGGVKTARRFPAMGRSAATTEPASESVDTDGDAGLFL